MASHETNKQLQLRFKNQARMLRRTTTETACYPASMGFFLAWLLAFTKSFASLVSRVVGLGVYKTKQLPD